MNKKNLRLHKYGNGPFCKFSVDKTCSSRSGVYLIVVNDEIKYVGECTDLYGRFSAGYGNISPRNCFEGGQQTNCRINSKILSYFKAKQKIKLYFLESLNRHKIEDLLIESLKPLWNK